MPRTLTHQVFGLVDVQGYSSNFFLNDQINYGHEEAQSNPSALDEAVLRDRLPRPGRADSNDCFGC